MSAETARTRKYMYLITDHPDDELVGNIEFTDKPRATAEKNVETLSQRRNVLSGETWSERIVGLGYHDFDGESDYEERAADVANEKLGQIDGDHLKAAGLDPAEYGENYD